MEIFDYINSNFFGALSGALVAGLIAIWISYRENKKREKQKNESIKKKIVLLQSYTDDLRMLHLRVHEIVLEMRKIRDPFKYIDNHTDVNGVTHQQPSLNEIKNYERQMAPFKKSLTESLQKTIDVLEEIYIVDIEILREPQYKKIIKNKRYLNNVIAPIIKKKLINNHYFTDDDLNFLKNAFNDFTEIIHDN